MARPTAKAHFKHVNACVRSVLASLATDITRLEVWLSCAGGPECDEALLALRLHAFHESRVFLDCTDQLLAALKFTWRKAALGGAPFASTAQTDLLKCMQLVFRMAVCALQKAAWGVVAPSADKDTLLGFCVPAAGHLNPIMERPRVRDVAQRLSDWLHSHRTAVGCLVAGVGAAMGAASFLKHSGASAAAATAARDGARQRFAAEWRPAARAALKAAGTALALGGATSAMEALGSSVSLRLTTRFIGQYQEVCTSASAAASLGQDIDASALHGALKRCARLCEEYAVFLDAVGAEVPSLSALRAAHTVSQVSASDSTVASSSRGRFESAAPIAALEGDDSGSTLDPRDSASSSRAPFPDALAGSASGSASGVFHLHPATKNNHCVICLCPLTPRGVLVRSSDEACGKFHAFHAACLDRAKFGDDDMVCPVCRRPFGDPCRFTIPTPFVPAAHAARPALPDGPCP